MEYNKWWSEFHNNPIIYLEAKKMKVFLKWFMDNGWICYWHFAWWF